MFLIGIRRCSKPVFKFGFFVKQLNIIFKQQIKLCVLLYSGLWNFSSFCWASCVHCWDNIGLSLQWQREWLLRAYIPWDCHETSSREHETAAQFLSLVCMWLLFSRYLTSFNWYIQNCRFGARNEREKESFEFCCISPAPFSYSVMDAAQSEYKQRLEVIYNWYNAEIDK